jgi:hypothetical protein
MFQENFTPLDQNDDNGLVLQTGAVHSLREAGKWGRFIAIAYFVLMGIGVLGILLTGATSMMMLGTMGSGLVVLYMLFMAFFVGLGIYLTYKLYLFSVNAIKAADTKDSNALSISVDSLKTLFKFTG